MIMGSLKEINQDAQANGVRPSTLPDGAPSIARQLGRHVILVGFFVATQGQSQKAKTWIANDSGVCVAWPFLADRRPTRQAAPAPELGRPFGVL